MAGVEVLAGLGVLATGLFRYNRENYEFDQEQRFEREELRLKMQVERFSLFREDVRDLVELTVSKMDLYHMVGALFLKACIVYYCEGFWSGSAPPVYLLSLYYLSNACSVVYLLLGVWLAMHASITSHSYGTQLLTRFIRLPIPGSDEMNTLNARFADFERQGARQMLRLPFLHREDGKAKANEWQQRDQLDAPQSPNKKKTDYLKDDVQALPHDNDEELLQAVEMRTQRHVNLFRKLQANWQCYDAYARVCMSLGARQLVQSITYFLIGVCLVENRNYATVFGLVFVLQAAGASISILDVSHWPCWKNLDLTLLGWGPGLCAALAWVLHLTRGQTLNNKVLVSFLSLSAFPLEMIWFELLLRAATPTDDMASLPQHFRSVVFMDVFAEVDDPTQMDITTGHRKLTPEEKEAAERALVEAVGYLHLAHAALRRWQALPGAALNQQQVSQRSLARRNLKESIKGLQKDLLRWGMTPLSPEEVHLRGWEEVSVVEREQDPFAHALLGPLEQQDRNTQRYYLDLERSDYVTDTNGRRVLTLVDLLEKVKDFDHEVAVVREAAGDRHEKSRREVGADTTSDDEEATPMMRGRMTRMHSVQLETDARKYKDGSKKVVKAVPNRLPWILVKWMTRCAQIAWLAVFVVQIIDVIEGRGFPKIDTMVVNIEEDRRRLAASLPAMAPLPVLSFEQLEVTWPMGGFFRPEALSFLPERGSEAADASRLIVRSPFALYQGGLGASPARLEELTGFSYAPGATAVCRSRSLQHSIAAGPSQMLSGSCLLAAPSSGGVRLWTWGGSGPGGEGVEVALEGGASWRVLAGASVPCRDAGLTLTASEAWCALLVGWPGGEALSVVAVPLAAGPGSAPLEAVGGPALRPHYELPLDAPLAEAAEAQAPSIKARGDRSVAALHLEPEAGRLWAVLVSGELLAWSLLPGTPRLLGRWSVPSSLGNQSFQVAAVGEAPRGRGLFVAGRTAGGPGAVGGPALLRAAALPPGL